MGKVAKNAKPKVKNLNSDAVVSAQLKKKIDKKIKQKRHRKRAERGVVLLRHLPKGFFEEQIKAYFAQFGDVTRVRLARSRKTGGSKSFAFVEFKVPEVAKIAAETMDNYLMFQKLVKAHYIPPGELKFDYLRSKIKPVINSHGKTVFSSKKMLAKSKLARKHNNWNEKEYSVRVAKAMKKLEKMKKKYSDLGIDFDSIVIKPKLAVPSNEENLQNAENLNTTNTSQTSDEGNEKPGKLLIVKKRKNLTATDDKIQQKKKKEPLRLLLEETLNDSDTEADEDYLPTEDYNPNETLEIPPNSFANILSKKLASKLKDVASDSESDESFKISDVEDEDDDEEMESEEEDENLSFEMNSSISETEEEDSSDNEETEHTDIKNKTKKSKFEKENRLEKIIRRKPGAGGIIKRNVVPKSDKMTAKKSVQLGKMKALAAGEIVKEKNLQKVKKTDLKMKKKVK